MVRGIFLFIGFLGLIFQTSAQSKILWEIGEANDESLEFALAPDGYQDFLKNDFGWEDRFYVIGNSKPNTDFPYVLPGAADYWGGTSVLSGIRPHELNILFSVEKNKVAGNYRLVVDLLDCSPENPPLVKISVNGKSWKFKLDQGSNAGAYQGKGPGKKEQLIQVPIDPEYIREGGNEIELTILEGSWMVFDQVRLEGPSGVNLQKPKELFIRNVVAGEYEIKGESGAFQPLLVDVQHLTGTPVLEVFLDEEKIFSKVIEKGRYELEVPMPAISTASNSFYRINSNGKTIQSGKIARGPQVLAKHSDYVDTKIGTGHSRWMIAPGPWMPFSMVKISPDNQSWGWQAGYQPSFESIGTFSHIHEWTMAGLGTFPTNGPLNTTMGEPEKPENGYRSRFEASTEVTDLGYYAVELADYGIRAELTATTRASFQRYTYPEGSKNSRILIDLVVPSEYRYQIEEAFFEQIGANKIVGYSRQSSKNVWGERHYRKILVENADREMPWDEISQDYTVHFVMEFDQPIKKFGLVMEESSEGNTQSKTFENPGQITLQNPTKAVAYVEFDTDQNPVVQTRTGISYVSIENAGENLAKEISAPFGWNFNQVKEAQQTAWNELFGRVTITSDDRMEKTRFYSNMYRALVSRNIYSDVDGSWMDATEQRQVLQDPEALALGCDAFWNTFWNLNQFWNLVTPDWSSKWVKSQLAMFDANGWLAKGPAGMEYIPVMVAEHEIPLIVAAYQMGIRDFDAEKAFEAVYKMQTTPGMQVGNGFAGNRDLESYLKYQYVPYNKGRFSNTLEYAFDDFAVAQFAKSLGKQSEYRQFSERSCWWKNAIDSNTGFARMKDSYGKWYQDFDPFKSGGNHQYVEGNAWQLTFFVPQDVRGLAEIIGEEKLSERLDWGFEASSGWRYNAPNELYWDFPVIQGNQQSMHFAYLFNWMGKPWLTQKWTRDIMDRYYGYGVSNAYLGDEDQGQMSAWFVMSALGLFQVDGGTSSNPVYELGSPIFEKTVINLGGLYGRGESFTIEAKNTSRLNKYIQSARLNGKTLNNFWFAAEDLLKGGTLELIMGPTPNRHWGTGSFPIK